MGLERRPPSNAGVFEAKESAPKNYLIRHVHMLTMHRYPGIGEDVEREIAAFVAFARDHLPERFVEATPVPTESLELVRMLRAG